jgi:HNH endonuclease
VEGEARRFWGKVDRSGGPDACWPWTASRKEGYGQFWTNREHNPIPRAHRVAYELTHGEIPEGHLVHHLCENRLCVNPAHLVALEPGEHVEGHIGQLALFGREGSAT